MYFIRCWCRHYRQVHPRRCGSKVVGGIAGWREAEEVVGDDWWIRSSGRLCTTRGTAAATGTSTGRTKDWTQGRGGKRRDSKGGWKHTDHQWFQQDWWDQDWRERRWSVLAVVLSSHFFFSLSLMTTVVASVYRSSASVILSVRTIKPKWLKLKSPNMAQR